MIRKYKSYVSGKSSSERKNTFLKEWKNSGLSRKTKVSGLNYSNVFFFFFYIKCLIVILRVVLRNKTHGGTLIMSDKRRQCLAEMPGMSLQLPCKLVACLAESANGKYDTGPKFSNFTGLW